MGVISDAAEVLQGDVKFVPVQDQLESEIANPWTLRDALTVSLGCHRQAGLFAYWEHRELGSAINDAWSRLQEHTGGVPPEVWSNQSGRTRAEVLELLDKAAAVGDTPGPGEVRLRPWCDPGLARTCAIPFVPLAAVVHAWRLEPCGLQELLDRFGIGVGTDPWTILERIEPVIFDTACPEDVSLTADALRVWMMAQRPPRFSPALALHDWAATDPALDPDGLLARLQPA